MGNVLAAKDGIEGDDWDYQRTLKAKKQQGEDGFTRLIPKGTPLTTQPLPKLFEPHGWEKISQFNKLTCGRIHDAELPRLADGRAFIIIPHSEFIKEGTVAFLQDIGVRSFLLTDRDALVVKDEETYSDSSFIL